MDTGHRRDAGRLRTRRVDEPVGVQPGAGGGCRAGDPPVATLEANDCRIEITDAHRFSLPPQGHQAKRWVEPALTFEPETGRADAVGLEPRHLVGQLIDGQQCDAGTGREHVRVRGCEAGDAIRCGEDEIGAWREIQVDRFATQAEVLGGAGEEVVREPRHRHVDREVELLSDRRGRQQRAGPPVGGVSLDDHDGRLRRQLLEKVGDGTADDAAAHDQDVAGPPVSHQRLCRTSRRIR